MKTYFARGNIVYDPSLKNHMPLYINNFGYYREPHEDVYISRPKGRADFHLIYVSSGEAIVNGKKLENDNFYILYPGQPQEYVYKSRDKSLYYWIHFTGSQTEQILKERGFGPGFYEGNGRRSEIDALLSLMKDSFGKGTENYDAYSTSLLYSFIQLLAAPKRQYYPFSRAAEMLEDLSLNVNVAELAHMYKMSEAHFIRSFRKARGATPANYRIYCRVVQAKNLLTDTELSISAIAQQCGIEDSLYFSRFFRKHTGHSPSEYRKMVLQ